MFSSYNLSALHVLIPIDTFPACFFRISANHLQILAGSNENGLSLLQLYCTATREARLFSSRLTAIEIYGSLVEMLEFRTLPLARLGLLVPSSNTTVEAEFAAFSANRFTLHVSRMHIVETTVAGLTEMENDLESSASLLATADPSVVAFACTTGSLINGREYEVDLIRRIERITGRPAVTTAKAVVDALRCIGATRIIVATPYVAELNRREQEYLESYGFQVTEIAGMEISENLEIGHLTPDSVFNFARSVARRNPEGELLFLSCTNLPTFPVIDALRKDLGIPVLSSNQATLWDALGRLKISASLWDLVSDAK